MKYPGDDEMLLKKLSEKSLSFLDNSYKKCFQLAYFPAKWKNARVIQNLNLDKNPAEVLSYRPISLLSSIRNFFEKVILNIMIVHINENSTTTH